MRNFVETYRQTEDLRLSAQCSAGNGALMRIVPVVVLHTADGSPDLWIDAILGTAVTHNDPAAIASSVAFVGMVAELLSMASVPRQEWWVDTFCRRAGPIEGNETCYLPRDGPLFGNWSGPLWQFVKTFVPASADQSTLAAAEKWYSGAYLLETVPTALHILLRYANDPEEAIVRAVNDTKDNDTIAAIVGAAVGALHGESGLPSRWRRDLLGRMIADVDDRRVFDLIAGDPASLASFRSSGPSRSWLVGRLDLLSSMRMLNRKSPVMRGHLSVMLPRDRIYGLLSTLLEHARPFQQAFGGRHGTTSCYAPPADSNRRTKAQFPVGSTKRNEP